MSDAHVPTLKDFLDAKIFFGMPAWSSIVYCGAMNSKLLHFKVAKGEKERSLYIISVISKEEKLAWQSFQDLLDHSVSLAQGGMQGMFGLDVLSVDMGAGIQHFNGQDFSRLLINHAKALDEEHKVLIRYGQIFALLHQRAPADWGKIDLKTHVEIVDPTKFRMGTYLKKIFRESAATQEANLLIHDISHQPLWVPEPLAGVPIAGYYLHHRFGKIPFGVDVDIFSQKGE